MACLIDQYLLVFFKVLSNETTAVRRTQISLVNGDRYLVQSMLMGDALAEIIVIVHSCIREY